MGVAPNDLSIANWIELLVIITAGHVLTRRTGFARYYIKKPAKDASTPGHVRQ